MRILGSLLVLALVAPAEAAPAADLVFVWAPGMPTAPVEAAARRNGAAVVDQSPKPAATAQTAQLVLAGVQGVEAAKLEEAWSALERARSEVDRTGAEGLTQAQLSDLFLYRGLVKGAQGDPTSSWEELVAANTIDPTRELDPARFAPKVLDDFKRAHDTVQTKAHAKLTVQAPDGCATTVDGRPALGDIDLVVGPHWVNTRCPDRRPTGYRIELTGDVRLPIEPSPYLPPDDQKLERDAAKAGARSFVVVEVRGSVGTARLLGLDGTERNRKTVTLTGDLTPLAEAVDQLLAQPAESKWYRSKWVWAIGGAAVAAAVLVPLTAYFAGASTTANPTGRPTWPTADGGAPW